MIEIPYGSQNKYELDPETGVLTLDRVLFSAEFYPFNYGFIPSTKAEDGDAVDVAVLLTNPVPPMTVVKARPIGMIKKIDSGEQDNLILAVPVSDPRFHDLDDVSQLPKHRVKEITDFFANYKRLQDKVVVIQGVVGRAEAEAEVAAYLNNYTKPDHTE